MADVLEHSILNGTKKILGLSSEDTSFDHDVATFINSALATINQLGIGPDDGLVVTDESTEWDDLTDHSVLQSHCRSYVYLVCRQLFDPPQLGYLIDAQKEQKREHEFRLTVTRDQVKSEGA